MLVYSKASKKSIDNAVAKAKSIKPVVKVLGYGQFEVTGTSNTKYTVTFSFNPDRELVIDCSCAAGKNGLVCFHSASVAPCYKLQVRNLQVREKVAA